MEISVNQAAFCTTTALAIGTGLAVVGAATTASTVAIVAYSILACTLGAVTIASISAWVASKTITDAHTSDYYAKMYEHAAHTIPAMLTLVSQMLVQALVQGLAQGVSKAISRKIAGPDQTIEVKTA